MLQSAPGMDLLCNKPFLEFVTMLHFENCLICITMATNVNNAGQTHDQLQAACYKWACRIYHPYIYRRLIAIPNDMHAGNVVRWKQYQAIGVTPGVWDMQLNWITLLNDQRFNFHGKMIISLTCWWEFKVGIDELSPMQIKFRNDNEKFGHIFNVASEEHEFQQQFKNIIEPNLEQIKKMHGC